MIEIVVSQNNHQMARYSFDRGTISLGRSSGNEIQLNSPAVSDEHARITLFENRCLIQAVDSGGALIINDKEVQRTTLHNQDVIHIGPYQLTVLSDSLNQAMTSSKFTVAEAPTAPGDDPGEAADRETSGKSEHTETEFSPRILLATGVDVLSGPARGKRIYFTGQSAKLGLNNETMVTIIPTGDGYAISALNSSHLTVTLNGKPMEDAPLPLIHGDLIEFSNLKSRFFTAPGS